MGFNGYVIRAGDLRNRITLQTRVTAQDPSGQPVESWVDAFKCWASISPLTGRELIAAQQVQSSVTHNITVRYRREFGDPKTVANMRAVYGVRVFNIHACMNQEERNRAVDLLVEEGLNNG